MLLYYLRPSFTFVLERPVCLVRNSLMEPACPEAMVALKLILFIPLIVTFIDNSSEIQEEFLPKHWSEDQRRVYALHSAGLTGFYRKISHEFRIAERFFERFKL